MKIKTMVLGCLMGVVVIFLAHEYSMAQANSDPPDRTMVFYEAVHRISESLADMSEMFGDDRLAFMGRELTKLHEQGVQGTLRDLHAMLGDGSIAAKGEFVIVDDMVSEAATLMVAAMKLNDIGLDKTIEMRGPMPGVRAD